MSRTVDGAVLFCDREKETLRKMITQVADFSGVNLLTYCIMGNHFHILVEIPADKKISDPELMRRYKKLYPVPTKYQAASAEILFQELKSNGPEAEAIRKRFLSRMGDVSEFMKTLKQRFSTWFNKTHDRYGPLWSDRFKSVLVEPNSHALQTIAAYIDLNAVRAGFVDDPKDYRFCGYAEAVSSNALWQKGIARVAGSSSGNSINQAMQSYRILLFGKGSGPVSAAIDRDVARRVIEEEDGCLSRVTILRCRIRYFTDGVILGSREFVQSHFDTWQDASNKKRAAKTFDLDGSDWGDMAIIKRLRRGVFS